MRISPMPPMDELKNVGVGPRVKRTAPILTLTAYAELPVKTFALSELAEIFCSEREDGTLFSWHGESDIVACAVQILDMPELNFPPHWVMVPVAKQDTAYGPVVYLKREIKTDDDPAAGGD